MYDQYEQKVIKRLKVLQKLYRLRFLIISILALLVIAASGFTFGRGYVFSSVAPKDVYEYGEKISFTAKALFSKASYEFRLKDSSVWKDEVPEKVGEYFYRPRGKNNLSSYYYGAESTFKIVPKDITVKVKEKQLTYGEVPTLEVVSGSLEGRDSIAENYEFNYKDTTTLKWKIEPKVDSLHVYNDDDEDVTSCYNFSSKSEDVTIIKRLITIATDSDKKEYDQRPLVNDNYRIVEGTLKEDESLYLISDPLPSITDVGIKSNNLAFEVRNSEGDDLSIFYALTVTNGNLEVAKRKIDFKSNSFDYVYDGTPKEFTVDDVTMTGDETALLANHEVEIKLTNEQEFIDVGTYTNSFTVKIIEDGVDVTTNYDIVRDLGKTVITERRITVTAHSIVKTYDKQSVTLIGYSIDPDTPLAEKDEIREVEANKYTDSGIYVNNQIYSIVDKNTNAAVNHNYIITKHNGEVIINKKPLTVGLKPLSFVYDGNNHTHEITDFEYNIADLMENDELQLVKLGKKRDAGTYDNHDFKLDIIDKTTGLSNLENYDLTIEGQSESLVIEKRPLTVEIIGQSKVYDSKKILATLPNGTETSKIIEGSLADSDFIIFDYSYDSNPHEVGTYPIHGEFRILRYVSEYDWPDMLEENVPEPAIDQDVTHNYDLTIINNSFIINQRSLTIETLDFTHDYDRQLQLPIVLPMSQPFYSVGGEGLVDGHYIDPDSLSITAPYVDVGEYPYIINYDSFTILDNSGNDVTHNYATIFVNSGKRIIKPRPATLTMKDGSKIYDGLSYSSSAHEMDGFLAGDYIEFSALPAVSHVAQGTISNPGGLGNIKVRSAEGDDVTANYDLTLNESNIWRTPRAITLASSSHSKTFDNTPFDSGEVNVVEGSLADGDKLVIDSLLSTSSAKHVHNNGKNTFDFHIENSSGEDVTADYLINFDYGDFEIIPFELELKMLEVNKAYNGTNYHKAVNDLEVTKLSSPLYINGGTNGGTLLAGFKLFANDTEVVPIINVGTYDTPVYDFWLTHTLEDAYSEDFKIIFNDHPYNIRAREITVQSASGSKQYDGLPFDTYPTITSGSLAPGDTIYYGEIEWVKEKGVDMINPIGKIAIRNSDGEDVTANYNITRIYGRVTIYEPY